MNKRIQLLLMIIMFIMGAIRINAQYDLNIKITESDFNSILSALVEAHGINYGDYSGGYGLQAWFANVDQATVDIKPNNVININVNLAAVAEIDIVIFSGPAASHHTFTILGHLEIVGNTQSGYKFIYVSDNIPISIAGIIVNEFPQIEINLGTSILPASLSSLFTSGVPQITTTESEIILGFDLQGSDYFTVKNNFSGVNNSGLVTVNGSQKYSPYSGQISSGGSATISAIDQVVDGVNYKFSHWSNGSTSRSITLNQPGVYSANFTVELYASITGPATLNETESGTYTCNASGGNSSNYNYQWEIRKEGNLVETLGLKGKKNKDGEVIIEALPSNQWFTCGADSYQYTKVAPNNGDYRSFDLRCTVTDANNTQYTSNIISVSYNSGASASMSRMGYDDKRVEITSGEAIENQKCVSTEEMAVTDNNLENEIVEKEYSLINYPNPFNPATIINYQLAEESKVSLKVYNVLGKEVAELVNCTKAAGRYTVNFNASSLPSGVYIYTLQTNKQAITRKMLLMK